MLINLEAFIAKAKEVIEKNGLEFADSDVNELLTDMAKSSNENLINQLEEFFDRDNVIIMQVKAALCRELEKAQEEIRNRKEQSWRN